MMPKLSEAFSSWKRPEINLEFDHRGVFKEMCGSTFFYEGGESKLAFTGTIRSDETDLIFLGIKGAKRQLEQRFHLIDVVAELGFNITCHYSGKVYVPYLPSNITERKVENPIHFIRRQSPTSGSLSHSSKVKKPQIMELRPIDSYYLFKIESLDVAVQF